MRCGGVLGILICNDRRWPEAFRVLGLQGVELVLIGYNTPAVNGQVFEPPHLRAFHNHLTMQAGAYQNGTWVVGVAKAGREGGVDMMGGSAIISPNGEIMAQSASLEDELILTVVRSRCRGLYQAEHLQLRRPSPAGALPADRRDGGRSTGTRRGLRRNGGILRSQLSRGACTVGAGRRRRRQSAAMIAMGDDPDDDGVLHIGAMGQQGALDQAQEGPGVGDRDIDEPGHGGLRQGFRQSEAQEIIGIRKRDDRQIWQTALRLDS